MKWMYGCAMTLSQAGDSRDGRTKSLAVLMFCLDVCTVT